MEPRIEYSPLIQQAGKPLYKGLFCASSDENIQGQSEALEHELRAQAAMRIATKILTQKEIYHG
mgnify:CR=1 FL=1